MMNERAYVEMKFDDSHLRSEFYSQIIHEIIVQITLNEEGNF